MGEPASDETPPTVRCALSLHEHARTQRVCNAGRSRMPSRARRRPSDRRASASDGTAARCLCTSEEFLRLFLVSPYPHRRTHHLLYILCVLFSVSNPHCRSVSDQFVKKKKEEKTHRRLVGSIIITCQLLCKNLCVKNNLLAKLVIREYIRYYNVNAIFTEGQAARALLNFSYILNPVSQNQLRIEFPYLGSRPLCKGKYVFITIVSLAAPSYRVRWLGYGNPGKRGF